MFFNKQLDELKRNTYKLLSEIELEVKDVNTRKEITFLLERLYLLNPKTNKHVTSLMKDLFNYVKELKRELITPIDAVIKNYLNKINEVVNQIQYESE